MGVRVGKRHHIAAGRTDQHKEAVGAERQPVEGEGLVDLGDDLGRAVAVGVLAALEQADGVAGEIHAGLAVELDELPVRLRSGRVLDDLIDDDLPVGGTGGEHEHRGLGTVLLEHLHSPSLFPVDGCRCSSCTTGRIGHRN